MKRLKLILYIGIMAFSLSAATISVNGTVTSKSGKPVAGAKVMLVETGLSATTGSDGKFILSGETGVSLNETRFLSVEKFTFNNGIVELRLQKAQPVRIELFGLSGNLLGTVVYRTLQAGNYRYDIRNLPQTSAMLLVRVTAGDLRATRRYIPGLDVRNVVGSAMQSGFGTGGIAKMLAAVDSLKVTAAGYLSTTVAISSFDESVTIVLDSLALAKFSFFVTSFEGLQELSGNENGFGGDLRFGKTGPGAGLAGADSICQCLAEMSMPGSAAKQWRAFLSAVQGADGKQVDARDRIGEGPWYDRVGRLLAANKTDLLQERPAGADPAIVNDFPNEYGVPNHRPDPNLPEVDNHLTITGSDSTGRLFDENSTCEDWTSTTTTTGRPRAGLSWPRIFGGGFPAGAGGGGFFNMSWTNWISTWSLPGCEAGADLEERTGAGKPGAVIIGSGGGYGGFYCFALNP